jgi:hypothetical protein
VYRHRSVSLNDEKICCEISEDKIAFCEKTAGLRSGNFSDLNSACSKVLVNENRFLGTFRGHNTRTTGCGYNIFTLLTLILFVTHDCT